MARRGVVLEKALASEKLPPIVADERRIIQLLSNLIGNALKFTEKVQPGRGALRGVMAGVELWGGTLTLFKFGRWSLRIVLSSIPQV